MAEFVVICQLSNIKIYCFYMPCDTILTLIHSCSYVAERSRHTDIGSQLIVLASYITGQADISYTRYYGRNILASCSRHN